jgi:type I restriction enzyme S subunit
MPKARLEGLPYISTKDFTPSSIAFDAAKLISRNDFEALSRKIQPESNDILISRYGTVGEVRRVTTTSQFQASYSVAIVKTCKSIDVAPWLALTLTSPIPQAFMRAHIRASAQPDLGLHHIRQVPIPMPPFSEQQEIMRRVDQLFALADSLVARVDQTRVHLQRTRQAVLAKAFRGELVAFSLNGDHGDG